MFLVQNVISESLFYSTRKFIIIELLGKLIDIKNKEILSIWSVLNELFVGFCQKYWKKGYFQLELVTIYRKLIKLHEIFR